MLSAPKEKRRNKNNRQKDKFIDTINLYFNFFYYIN
jgi:hypothetical protein